MLHLVAPCIESHGHEAKLVTILRDAREEIDWRRVQRDEPDVPHVLASEMPPEPSEQPDWDYHRWVLGMSSWHGFWDEHGRPVLPQGPAFMPPPAEQHESPEIQPMHESPEIDSDFYISVDFFYQPSPTAASPHQPYLARAHDWEASGSGTHPDYASQLADFLLHTPPPPLATRATEPDDPWSRALTMSAQAEPEEEITPTRRAHDRELEWDDWHERNFSRKNRGRAAHRFIPSDWS